MARRSKSWMMKTIKKVRKKKSHVSDARRLDTIRTNVTRR